MWVFPGGPAVESLPAMGDMDPYSMKIPHVMEKLSPCTTNTELALRAAALQWEKPPQRKAWALRPASSQLESPHTAMKTTTAKNSK